MSNFWPELSWNSIEKQAVLDLQALLQIDTTNPPGNEEQAIRFLDEQLRKDGLEPVVLESAPGRSNLVVRIEGEDPSLEPLMLSAHVDVVPAEGDWTHPPFQGTIDDGYIWGRGAIDMKNMVIMSMWVMKLLARNKRKPRRTIIFAAVADEERGCHFGSHWLVDHHPDLVRAGYVLSEIGGFTLFLQGKRFYPIQVAEKGQVQLKIRVHGQSSHGSMPRKETTITRLSKAITKLNETPLPMHVTPVQEAFVRRAAKEMPFPFNQIFPLLLTPLGKPLLSILPDSISSPLKAALHNTVNATVLRAGEQHNVVPASAEVLLDGRTLPGFSSKELLAELKDVLQDPHIEFEVEQEYPPVENDDYENELFALLCEMLKKHDPEGTPVPWLCVGFTDAKAWSRLGAKCYGFSPLKLPPEVKFSELFHGIDERIPVEGFTWGLKVLAETVARFAYDEK